MALIVQWRISVWNFIYAKRNEFTGADIYKEKYKNDVYT